MRTRTINKNTQLMSRCALEGQTERNENAWLVSRGLHPSKQVLRAMATLAQVLRVPSESQVIGPVFQET